MGWKEAKDPQGRVYYYNDEGQTTWEKPEELFTAFEKRLLSHGWKSALTEDGKVYYYKPSTGETTWEAPIKDEVVTEEEQRWPGAVRDYRCVCVCVVSEYFFLDGLERSKGPSGTGLLLQR